MDAITCITTRRSIRKFRPEPVPGELLQEVLDTARWSPSYKNSQPWEAVVVSGVMKEQLSRLQVELLEAGVPPCPDLAAPVSWPEPEQARITHMIKGRAARTGIDLCDPQVILRAKKANFGFYGAPHAIYLFQEGSLSLWSLFDLGLFAQSLMLAAHARGLGTVPQAFATDYARDIKRFLKIPESKRLVLGLSIGYPDEAAPINQFRTERSATAEFTRWLE